MEESIKLYNLDNLIGMIGEDPESLKEFIKLFLETSIQTLDELNSSFKEENYSHVGAMAHKLKSSIDLMGIDSLKTDIRTIERIGKDKENIQELKELVPKLNDLIKQVHVQMKVEL